MATLPTPGSDTDTWGSELNTYLSVEHSAGGHHEEFANNIGIGGTPQDWDSTITALHVGGLGSLSSVAAQAAGGYTMIANNMWYDETDTRWEYIVADEGCLYQQENGNHHFYTAAVGAAGGAVSLTHQMVIAGSGNIGVGTTSPSIAFDIHGAMGDSSTTGHFLIYPATATATTPTYSFLGDGNTGMYRISADTIGFSTGGTLAFTMDVNGGISMPTTGTMTIQNVAGSAATPTYTFKGDGTTGMYRAAAQTIGFATDGTSQFTIDSTGNLKAKAASMATLQAVAGSASFPTYTFVDDYDTGMYRSAANEIAFATNGVQRVAIGNSKFLVSNMPAGSTQVASGAGTDELWTTNSHATLPDNVVMIGV